MNMYKWVTCLIMLFLLSTAGFSQSQEQPASANEEIDMEKIEDFVKKALQKKEDEPIVKRTTIRRPVSRENVESATPPPVKKQQPEKPVKRRKQPEIKYGDKSYQNNDILNDLNNPRQTNRNMQNAINSITRVVEPEKEKRTVRKETQESRTKAYKSKLRALMADKDDNISIPEAEFTDFEFANGIHDYEKAIETANANRETYKICVDKYYIIDPTLNGSILVKFDVHPKGYVIPGSIKVVETDVKNGQIIKCLEKTISRWRNFPVMPIEMGRYTLTQKYRL